MMILLKVLIVLRLFLSYHDFLDYSEVLSGGTVYGTMEANKMCKLIKYIHVKNLGEIREKILEDLRQPSVRFGKVYSNLFGLNRSKLEFR